MFFDYWRFLFLAAQPSLNIQQIYSCLILTLLVSLLISWSDFHVIMCVFPIMQFLVLVFEHRLLSTEYCTRLQENKMGIYIWNNVGIPDCLYVFNYSRQMLMWYYFSSLPERLMVQGGKWSHMSEFLWVSNYM